MKKPVHYYIILIYAIVVIMIYIHFLHSLYHSYFHILFLHSSPLHAGLIYVQGYVLGIMMRTTMAWICSRMYMMKTQITSNW